MIRKLTCAFLAVIMLFTSVCFLACAESTATYSSLKKGSKGTEVSTLQQRLIELYYLDGSASGKYDSATQKAVKAFQKMLD